MFFAGLWNIIAAVNRPVPKRAHVSNGRRLFAASF